ncbi:MAG: uncharacterized lipoprotein YehR (DUF1307 family), partial [Marivirga sp.]
MTIVTVTKNKMMKVIMKNMNRILILCMAISLLSCDDDENL